MSDETTMEQSQKKTGSNSAAAFMTALAALLAAIGSWVHTPEEKGAEASYKVLSTQLEAASKSATQNHDDIVALSSFLEGYIRTQEGPRAISMVSAPVSSKVISPHSTTPVVAPASVSSSSTMIVKSIPSVTILPPKSVTSLASNGSYPPGVMPFSQAELDAFTKGEVITTVSAPEATAIPMPGPRPNDFIAPSYASVAAKKP